MQKSINWEALTFDWNHVRAFLAAAEEGSLSRAARALNQTQPTVSRQITALEEDLGILLLERGKRGLTLTEPGAGLLEHARQMGQAALGISFAASGESENASGHVCITCTEAFATFHLPRMLKRLRSEAPGIQLTVVASNDVRDITRREADISIRHAPPVQPDLIGKQVGSIEARIYASRGYLERVGRPAAPADSAELEFIGWETPETLVPIYNGMGIPVTRDNFTITTASGTAILEMIRQGLGLGILTRDAHALFPDLELVFPDLEPLPVPIWLVTHRELRTSRRIRIVFDVLAEEIEKGWA